METGVTGIRFGLESMLGSMISLKQSWRTKGFLQVNHLWLPVSEDVCSGSPVCIHESKKVQYMLDLPPRSW